MPKVRALDSDGDMTAGFGFANYLINSVEMVAQRVKTRLLQYRGEWFLDVTLGVDQAAVLGSGTRLSAGPEYRRIILETDDVTEIVAGTFATNYDPIDRAFTVSCRINTTYGETEVNEVVT